MANWYYFDSHSQKIGLINDQQLQALIAQGIITPRTPLETESGRRGLAGHVPCLFPPNPFSGGANFNPQQVGQAADKAYRVTKTFAENSAWKTGLFRISQLMVVVIGEVLLILALLFDDNIRSFINSSSSEQGVWVLIRLIAISVIVSSVLIASLETAINTGKMVDYLREE
jgi:hypothetical protein